MCSVNRTILSLLLGVSLVSSLASQEYLGGELFSYEVVKYGRFEMRMKVLAAPGVISTFFTYFDSSWMNGQNWREIDMEVVGKHTDSFQSNIITGTSANRIMSDEFHAVGGNIDDAYHTFAIEWTPDYIAWFFDGQEVRRSTDQQVIDCREKEQSYRFNLWISDSEAWAGAFEPSLLPAYQFVNWFTYASYTPGQGDGGTDFTHQWREDFDIISAQKWGKGNWTFEGNQVTFSTKNVVTQDGYLILCLTEATAPGFSGTVPLDSDGGTPALRPSLYPVERSTIEGGYSLKVWDGGGRERRNGAFSRQSAPCMLNGRRVQLNRGSESSIMPLFHPGE